LKIKHRLILCFILENQFLSILYHLMRNSTSFWCRTTKLKSSLTFSQFQVITLDFSRFCYIRIWFLSWCTNNERNIFVNLVGHYLRRINLFAFVFISLKLTFECVAVSKFSMWNGTRSIHLQMKLLYLMILRLQFLNSLRFVDLMLL